MFLVVPLSQALWCILTESTKRRVDYLLTERHQYT
jgi:hypothetical protein